MSAAILARTLPCVPCAYVDRIAPGRPLSVWVVRCPFCRGEHVHGPGVGSRVADCHPATGPGVYVVTAGNCDQAGAMS